MVVASRAIVAVLVAAGTGCAHRIGDFTAISSKNVRLEGPRGPRVEGRSCGTNVFGVIVKFADLKDAIDEAIESAGSGYDALEDVVLTYQTWPTPVIQIWCYDVTGTAVATQRGGGPSNHAAQPQVQPGGYPSAAPPVMAAAPTVARRSAYYVYVNGNNVTGARGYALSGATVQIDAYGSLVINAPGYQMQPVVGGPTTVDGSVMLNGVNIDALRSQAFGNCTVQVDAAGTVHITAPGVQMAPGR